MSGSVSSIEKSSIPSWVDAGVWVDVVLVGMVALSAVGLAYLFFVH